MYSHSMQGQNKNMNIQKFFGVVLIVQKQIAERSQCVAEVWNCSEASSKTIVSYLHLVIISFVLGQSSTWLQQWLH